MTPQERRMVDELFERLATLETRPREPDAEQAIRAGLRKAPNATYALVQTVLLQEEAIRKADERIRALQSGEDQPQESGGFLDSMREAVFGTDRPRGSVPPTRGGDRPMGVPPGFRTGEGYGAGAMSQQAEPSRGGSFLGTAAAAAVGVIGGTMLMNSMRNMLGSGHPATGTPSTAADLGGNQSNPWSDASSSDLAKQAGVDQVGQSGSGERTGLYDQSEQPFDTADLADDGFDLGDSDVS